LQFLAPRNVLKPAAFTLLGALLLTMVLGYGALEQRTRALADSAQDMVSTNLSLATMLHFRNKSATEEALARKLALEIHPQKLWLRAIHVDGELVATASAGEPEQGTTSFIRASHNRLEVLWTFELFSHNAATHYQGELAAIPFMNTSLVISAPVFSPIDPLRTDVTRSAYQQAQSSGSGQPQRYVAGYIEQAIFLGDILASIKPTLLLALTISALISCGTLVLYYLTVHRANSETAQLANLIERAGEDGVAENVITITSQDPNLQQITSAFNQLADDYNKLYFRGEMAYSTLEENGPQHPYENYFDPITALPCHQLLLEKMTLLMDIAARERRYVGLVLLEVSNIGTILRTKGRDASDNVLREIKTRIVKSVRKSDIISRGYDAHGAAILDADQFCIVLHGIASIEGARAAAERLLNTLSVPISEDLTLQVLASVAVAPQHSETSEGLIGVAKASLNMARNSSTSAIIVCSEQGDD